MERAQHIDVRPALLPWALSEPERLYRRTRDDIGAALAGLSCRLWREAGVAVPAPARAAGRFWLGLGHLVQLIGTARAFSLLPMACAMLGFALADRPMPATVALVETLALAAGALALWPGQAMIARGNRVLLRVPPLLGPQAVSARNPRFGRGLRRAGWALATAAAAIGGLALTLAVLSDPGRPMRVPYLPEAPALLVIAGGGLAASLVLSAAGAWLTRVGLQTLQASADELRATDRRRPILLLRSFEDEDLDVIESSAISPGYGHSLALERMEESISAQFRPFGPLVAIGRPGDRLPLLGASRNYYAEADWRAAARQLMEDALLIVVIAGTTAGLRWELEQIAAAGHAGKLLVVMPEPKRAQRYEVILPLLAGMAGFAALPEACPAGVVCLHGGRDGAAVVLTAPTAWTADYDAAIHYALFGLLRPAGE